MQERIIRFITDNSHISPERLKELMTAAGDMVTDIGSVLDGPTAVREGVIDELGGLKEAMAALDAMIDEAEKE